MPGAMKDAQFPDGSMELRCVYTPHSLRATTTLDAGEDITKVQALLGRRRIATTQIYDKRRRSTSESASHNVPLWRNRSRHALPKTSCGAEPLQRDKATLDSLV